MGSIKAGGNGVARRTPDPSWKCAGLEPEPALTLAGDIICPTTTNGRAAIVFRVVTEAGVHRKLPGGVILESKGKDCVVREG